MAGDRVSQPPPRIDIVKPLLTKPRLNPMTIQSCSMHGQRVDEQSAGQTFGSLTSKAPQNVRERSMGIWRFAARSARFLALPYQ